MKAIAVMSAGMLFGGIGMAIVDETYLWVAWMGLAIMAGMWPFLKDEGSEKNESWKR